MMSSLEGVFFLLSTGLKIEVQQHTLISCELSHTHTHTLLCILCPAPCRKAVVSQHQARLQHPPQTGQQAGAHGATG